MRILDKVRSIALVLFAMVVLLATVAPAEAVGEKHQGEVFYQCFLDQRTKIGGTLAETFRPCNASADKSLYWAPVLYRDGAAMKPNKFHVYIRNAVKATPKVFPAGVRWVAGNANATSPQTAWSQRYFWQCGDTKANTHYATPPNCPNATNGQGETALTLIVRFPQCWNGSRWSYPTGGSCPSRSTLTVQLQEHVQYTIADAARSKMKLSSGSIYGVYAGFAEGWNSSVLQTYINQCVESGKSCHIRGDGTIS
jgi:Domain of unknown function (DUF1996)